MRPSLVTFSNSNSNSNSNVPSYEASPHVYLCKNCASKNVLLTIEHKINCHELRHELRPLK